MKTVIPPGSNVLIFLMLCFHSHSSNCPQEVFQGCFTCLIHSFSYRGKVVFYSVLCQLESVQTSNWIISSGPVERDIVDVITPCSETQANKSVYFPQ